MVPEASRAGEEPGACSRRLGGRGRRVPLAWLPGQRGGRQREPISWPFVGRRPGAAAYWAGGLVRVGGRSGARNAGCSSEPRRKAAGRAGSGGRGTAAGRRAVARRKGRLRAGPALSTRPPSGPPGRRLRALARGKSEQNFRADSGQTELVPVSARLLPSCVTLGRCFEPGLPQA